MKTCSKCKVEKDESQFYFRPNNCGLVRTCKECKSGYNRRYRLDNQSKVLENQRNYCRLNPEVISRRNAARYRLEPEYRIACLLRNRLGAAIAGRGKSGKTLELLGCPVWHLRAHFEFLFRPGMTWENQGAVWHIDHIKPCAKFDLADPGQQKACFHWTNLQPLFVLENLQKSDKYAPPEHTSAVVLG